MALWLRFDAACAVEEPLGPLCFGALLHLSGAGALRSVFVAAGFTPDRRATVWQKLRNSVCRHVLPSQ